MEEGIVGREGRGGRFSRLREAMAIGQGAVRWLEGGGAGPAPRGGQGNRGQASLVVHLGMRGEAWAGGGRRAGGAEVAV